MEQRETIDINRAEENENVREKRGLGGKQKEAKPGEKTDLACSGVEKPKNKRKRVAHRCSLEKKRNKKMEHRKKTSAGDRGKTHA